MNPLRSRLKIRHIQVVVAIAEMGNLLRAAQALNITQPAISKALAEVEDVVGERLFDRTPFGTKPTLAGDALIRYGLNVLADMDRMHDALSAIRRGEGGQLRVGVFSLISQWAPFSRALIRLRAMATGLSLTIEDGSMENLMSKLDAGTLDVVVGRYPYANQQSHHVVRGLAPDRIVAAVRDAHPVLTISNLSIADLVGYTWILPPEHNIVRIQLEMELKALGLAFKAVPLASLTIPVNVKLVQASDLVMLMPSSLALEQADSWQLEILPIELPVSVGPLVAISRGDRVVDRLRDALIEILLEEAKV